MRPPPSTIDPGPTTLPWPPARTPHPRPTLRELQGALQAAGLSVESATSITQAQLTGILTKAWGGVAPLVSCYKGCVRLRACAYA